jgi:UPF0755 protein
MEKNLFLKKLKESRKVGWLIAAGVVLLMLAGYWLSTIFLSGVHIKDKEKHYLYIPTGANFEMVLHRLDSMQVLSNRSAFLFCAKALKYNGLIKPGRYLIKKSMSNYGLVKMLRNGNQSPVLLTFNNIRTLPQLASVLSKQVEPDSGSLLKAFNDTAFVHKYGFNQYTFIANFIPNTYQLYWNISVDNLVTRLNKEYKKFWDDERMEQARLMGLTPEQIITLASIVDEESMRESEYPIIAGVYYNRLKKGMLLQADPTVKFALQDFGLRRILTKHLETNSPYNTYKFKGLPPGPIRIPSVKVINAVLNYTKHNYIYFCAREDFSGYHNFAVNESEHLVNAKKYQQALNARKIWK